jgi:hypothetical protein
LREKRHQHAELGAQPERAEDGPLRGRVEVADSNADRLPADVGEVLLGHPFGAVAGQDVTHLVADDRRQLVIGTGHRQKPRKHGDLSARQRKGVHIGRVEEHDLPTGSPPQ